MRSVLQHTYNDIISVENLCAAWQEFICGKRNKPDVQTFARHLEDNIMNLHHDLAAKTYRHGGYHAFRINDPKPRLIHKASVRDRLLHHAIHRILYPFFDRKFVADSFSCRIGKGTHRALDRFRSFARQASKNYTRTCWVLRCDIRKFFEHINHRILLNILATRISDYDILWLLERVIASFSSGLGRGLPLGNLTSQLLVNVYMNEFDQFVKHRLMARRYLRYADDFVLVSDCRAWLVEQIPRIRAFLAQRLRLELHPRKIELHTFASGVDFLGWVHFSGHRVLRAATARRMLHRMRMLPTPESYASYRGLLQHGNTEKLKMRLAVQQWLQQSSQSA